MAHGFSGPWRLIRQIGTFAFGAAPGARSRRRPARPRVEPLEARQLLAVAFHEFPIARLSDLDPIAGLTNGPDGALYFSYNNPIGPPTGDFIGRIATNGSFTLRPAAPEAIPAGLASGPGGAVWYADKNLNQIDKVTPSGAATTFDVNKTPEAIVAGPDGNLWFTEGDPFGDAEFDAIGRITPGGTVTDFPLPTPGTGILFAAITRGPGNTLWFTEPANDKIGEITTAGVITEFTLPTANAFPSAITFGPDGALWFTESFAGKIGRITPGGAVTEFRLPAGADPVSITAGPDGALWYLDAVNDTLGRITTAGVVTSETPLPGAAGTLTPENLVLGPDKNLWFTFAEGIVVQAVPSATPPSPPTDGPRVKSLVRFGYRTQPTSLVLSFDVPLDPVRAQDTANYVVVGPILPRGRVGHRDPVTSAHYDPVAHTVTLSLRNRINLHRTYRLVVLGTPPGGLTDSAGVLLDGAGNRRPGSDYETSFDGAILAGPAPRAHRAADAAGRTS